MSIQDDLFDVQAALKRKPEARAFGRLTVYLGQLEMQLERQREILDGLRAGLKALELLKK